MAISPGVYEHYKGNKYQVIGSARHTETLEELVVYQAIDDERKIWVRPAEMFGDTVVVDGETRLRFKLVSNS